MQEKRYLKWYNKIGYGSGDIAGNVVYAFLTFFVMIYLTDTVGLNSGIVGTLMDSPMSSSAPSLTRLKLKWARPVPGCCGLILAVALACSQSSPCPLPGDWPLSMLSSSSFM